MDEHSWVIESNDKAKLLSDITKAEKKAWERQSIYKLPACVTDLLTDKKKSAYKPQAVSFGPYHHGDPNLKLMEAHKERALLHLLNRSGKPLEHYIETLREILQDLMDAYDSLDDYWQKNSEAFLQLMIRDGCFMLEVLRISSTINDEFEDDYAANDPIFSNHGRLHMLPFIKRDMLMLENQLPMPLLRKLHAVYKPDAKMANEESIDKLIIKFYFDNGIPTNLDNCLHVLDAYRTILLWKDCDSGTPKRTRPCKKGEDDILPVIELEEAGVRIKKSKTTSLKDVDFDCHRGILWLPQIPVDDLSETMFLNLIAFERFHAGTGNEITDYIYFMDKLIDNAWDVYVLESYEIIQSAIGSDKAVAKLFNSLSKDAPLDPDSNLAEVRKMINSYCKTKWHKWRATLYRKYFTNPWASISLVGAIVLFALTIIQAVYGALQYYHEPKTK